MRSDEDATSYSGWLREMRISIDPVAWRTSPMLSLLSSLPEDGVIIFRSFCHHHENTTILYYTVSEVLIILHSLTHSVPFW